MGNAWKKGSLLTMKINGVRLIHHHMLFKARVKVSKFKLIKLSRIKSYLEITFAWNSGSNH